MAFNPIHVGIIINPVIPMSLTITSTPIQNLLGILVLINTKLKMIGPPAIGK